MKSTDTKPAACKCLNGPSSAAVIPRTGGHRCRDLWGLIDESERQSGFWLGGDGSGG